MGRALTLREPIVVEALSQIKDIYKQWLEGTLSQEDALFAIGDVFEHPGGGEGQADASLLNSGYANIGEPGQDR